MQSDQILHSPAIAKVMMNFASGYGVSADICLSETGISPDLLQDPDALITRTQEMRLLENIMAALPDVPALGFELGTQYNISAFGVWGFFIATCRNLREATELAIRYLPLSTAYCNIKPVVDGNEFAVDFDPSPIPEHLRQFLLERDIATAINLVREIRLVSVPVRRLELTGPAPAYAQRIEELTGFPPQYYSPHNRIVVSLEEVMEPLPSFNQRFVRQLEDQCRELLERRQAGGLVGQVRAILLGRSGFMKSTDEVAKELNTSSRSLRRKLEAEGTSYRGLVDECRQQLAEQLLDSTSMKVEELAFHLGYSDAASFTRAFRRWHKLSPGEYRKQNRPAD